MVFLTVVRCAKYRKEHQIRNPQRRFGLGILARGLLAFALILAFLPAQNVVGQIWAQQKIHPMLRAIAAQDGAQTVRVIVQQ